LHQQRDEAGLAVEEEEREHAHERREHGGQRHQPAEPAAARDIVAGKEKRERDPDQARQPDARE
jgi:hypothetical protein